MLDLWARDLPVPVNALERTQGDVAAAVLDDLDHQPFLLAALRGTRAGLAVGCHLATRVNGANDDEAVWVSARSVHAARQLATAAGDGQVLLSNDLGAFMSIARARFAANLESVRVPATGGPDVAAYWLRVNGAPPTTVRNPPGSTVPATAIDEGRRSKLFERLGAALTPYLGPIAPLMLQQLPPERMSAQQMIEAILQNVPEGQREPVRRAIEDEIRRLR
ncbi:MAG TPA: hypothetical protein VFV12_05180 [Xanthobacteraceae bacterium]|nr:hypothetical protein [Xanthobacteraceae bacterium]